MISFRPSELVQSFQLGKESFFDIDKIVFVTNDKEWVNRLSNASFTIHFECVDTKHSSSSHLSLGSLITPYHKQPVLEVNRRYSFSNELAQSRVPNCKAWFVRISLSNLDFKSDETLNLFPLEKNSYQLIPEESLRLENIFIDLKNQGKTINEIVNLLNLPEAIILEWEKNYNAALAATPKDVPFDIIIKGKGSDGKYIFSQSINFRLTTLDKIRFDLTRYMNIDEKTLEKAKDKESFIFLSNKAKEAHEILTKYVKSVSIKENGDNTISFSYNATTEDNEILKNINAALEFYFKTIYTLQRHAGLGQLITASNNNYVNAANILPIAVKAIAIKNYHGVHEIILKDFFTDSKWIFLTGENGFGKTIVLQAIAIGLNGTQDGDTTLLSDTNSFINVEYKHNNDSYLNNVWSYQSFHKLEELACYGPSRLMVAPVETRNEIDKRSSTTYSIFNPNGILLDIEFELLLNKSANMTLFNIYCDIFKKVIPAIHEIIVNEQERKIYYTEKDPDTDKPFPYQVNFNQLASGIRSLIAMVGDMIIRLSRSQPGVTDFSKLRGIAIVDEIDLHWHPKWQREIPKRLSEVFPNIQFIATTHSALPLLGAPRNSVFLKVDRDLENGITCRKVDVDIEKLLPNSVFTSPLFDLDKITNVNISNISEVNTNDSYIDIQKQQKIKENIKKFEDSDKRFPDDLFK